MFKNIRPPARRLFIDELRQRKKRRRRRIAFLVTFSVLALFVFLAYALFFSDWLSVREIRLSGNEEVPEEEIRNHLKPFSNILFANSEMIVHSLRVNFPVIDEVKVNKNVFERFLTVEISEREALGIWCPEGGAGCFYFDEELVLFRPAPKFSGRIFLVIEDGRGRDFKLGDRFDDKELFEKVFAARELLDQLQILEYLNFYLSENSFEFWVKTADGWPVYLDKETDIPTQLVALKKFLEEKLSASRRQTLEYIDLRISNRIYYK